MRFSHFINKSMFFLRLKFKCSQSILGRLSIRPLYVEHSCDRPWEFHPQSPEGIRSDANPTCALHRAVAITTCRMRFAVAPRIIGMTGAPGGLGHRLVSSVVGIGSKTLMLPGRSPRELAGCQRAVALIRNVYERSEKSATGGASPVRFHCGTPRALTWASAALQGTEGCLTCLCGTPSIIFAFYDAPVVFFHYFGLVAQTASIELVKNFHKISGALFSVSDIRH
jgi:hypothetical protein